jgi:hypothetical protein
MGHTRRPDVKFGKTVRRMVDVRYPNPVNSHAPSTPEAQSRNQEHHCYRAVVFIMRPQPPGTSSVSGMQRGVCTAYRSPLYRL